MASEWMAIFGRALLLATRRHRVASAWSSLHEAVFGTSSRVSGRTIRIPMAEDGHFWAQVSINGATRRMLIDSGATTTALSASTAAETRITLDELGFPAFIRTPTGATPAQPGVSAQAPIGRITTPDLPVSSSPAFHHPPP